MHTREDYSVSVMLTVIVYSRYIPKLSLSVENFVKLVTEGGTGPKVSASSSSGVKLYAKRVLHRLAIGEKRAIRSGSCL